MIPHEWLEQADERIDPFVQRTLLTYDEARKLYLKWENRQVTGSFKARGALNKVLLLEDWERQAGLVAASAGNHGQGVAFAASKVGAEVEVFVSEHAVPAKVEAMGAQGAKIHKVPGGYHEAEAAGKQYAETHDKTWISPYNDGQIIAGQGTVGLELMRQLSEKAQAWLVPVSGGGLVTGIGASMQKQAQSARLIGVQAKAAPFMHSLYYSGTQDHIPDQPSLADGLTGAVERNSVTIPMIKQWVDKIVLVSEEEIAHAMAFAWAEYKEKIEGSGAVGLAAILFGKVTDRPAVVVVSGGNVQPEVHSEIMQQYVGKP